MLRVLLIFHGRLPYGAWPVAGMALRAWTLAQGLRAHGIEVLFASRRRDQPTPEEVGRIEPPPPVVHPYEGGEELRALVASLAPDVLLVLGPDELFHLTHCPQPIVLDCFAPRILEAQWQGPDITHELTRTLDALARADYVLVTHARTRHVLLGLLPLAGFDCREDRLLTVPLSIPLLPSTWLAPGTNGGFSGREGTGGARSPHPLLVAGGVAWPWQDPSRVLAVAAKALRPFPRGRLELLRGPYPLSQDPQVPPLPIKPGRHVKVRGLLPYPALRSLYASAWCALDLMAPNLEREVALSFRQLDALAAGLPILTGPYAPLADLIQTYDAGWVVPHEDESTLATVLSTLLASPEEVERRGKQALRLGLEHFHPERSIQPLLAALQQPTRRSRQETLEARLSRRATEAAVQETTLSLLQERQARLERQLHAKDLELEAAGAQARTLTTTVGRLSAALEEALHLKHVQETDASDAAHQSRLEAQALARELGRLKTDLQKKQEALLQESTRREALEQSLEALHALERQARQSADTLASEHLHAQALAAQAQERASQLERFKTDLEQRLAFKEQALTRLHADFSEQAAEQARLATKLEQTLLQAAQEKQAYQQTLEETRRAFARAQAQSQQAMNQAVEQARLHLEQLLVEERLTHERQLQEERTAQTARLEAEQARHALALQALRDATAEQLKQWQTQQHSAHAQALQQQQDTLEALLIAERSARQQETRDAQARFQALELQANEAAHRHAQAIEDQRVVYEQALQELQAQKEALNAQAQSQAARQTQLMEDQRTFYEQALQELQAQKEALTAQAQTQATRQTQLMEDQRTFYEQALQASNSSKEALLSRLATQTQLLHEAATQQAAWQAIEQARAAGHPLPLERARQRLQQLIGQTRVEDLERHLRGLWRSGGREQG